MSTTEQKWALKLADRLQLDRDYAAETEALSADLEAERAAFKTCAQERYNYHANLVDMRYQLTAVTNERDTLRAQVEALTMALADANDSAAWHKRRTSLLQSLQSAMQEPERTIVCDVLANGHLLQGPDGKPDKQRYAAHQPSQPWTAVPWWRKRADEIELEVGCGAMGAHACYTQMRQLLQANDAAPQRKAAQPPAAGPEGWDVYQLLNWADAYVRQARPAVPEGWKLVPVEPTPAMKAAGVLDVGDSEELCLTWDELVTIYRAMLAAAPQPDGGASG